MILTACQTTAETAISPPTSPSPPTTASTTSAPTTYAVAPSTTEVPPREPGFRAAISDVSRERLARSYTSDCPVTLEDLVLIDLVHWGFDDEAHDGAIVVARSEAAAVVAVFAGLFEIGYPIESVVPIGDLPEGIEEDDRNYNNTSGLHCRKAVGSNRWSEHARGLAIDINPLLNPYFSGTTLWPANSGRYLDRTLGQPGMITSGDRVVALFGDQGWLWGGDWSTTKDYQHFSTTGR